MVKVDSFQIPGVRCWFWSEDHLPHHFHMEAESGEWNAKVMFLLDEHQMIQDVYSQKSKGIPAGIKKTIHEMVKRNVANLIREWERMHGSGS